jgi:MYXO-CTERM domain-containing protein
MIRAAIPVLAGLLAVPSAALAAQPPADCVDSIDIDPAWLVPSSVDTNHAQFGASNPQMFDVITSLGVISPYNAPDACLMSTGNVDNIEQLVDNDFPPGGAQGDRATLAMVLNVPEFANSYSFNFYFLSREYPEWVGDIYNDKFEVYVENPSFSGQIVFDAFGNVVSVNNALFGVTDAGSLAGTGFDLDGGTGWVTTIAPVTGGSQLEIMFTIYDEGDGVWDSAVILDNFQFSSQDPPGDGPWTGDDTPDVDMELAFLSPKEGDLGGGYPVIIHGVGFSETTSVLLDNELLDSSDFVLGTGGETITIESMPSSDTERSVDIAVIRDAETITLADAFTYWDLSGGSVPPRVTNVFPAEGNPSGGLDLRVRGEGIAQNATILFVSEPDEEGVSIEVAGVDPEVVELGDGAFEIVVKTPEFNSGWADLFILNPNADDADNPVRSNPGYPFLFTTDAADPGDSNNGSNRGGGCSMAEGSAGGALMLLGLLGLRRRREEA